ncbi:MAG TPA: TonB-dependent receptor [Blastocatellia bacterium]|nr:TonB-dependent receptor [Blastocatellia bacterium]
MQKLRKSAIRLVSLSLITLMLLPLGVLAQQLLGGFNGTVTDAAGAVVPQAEIKVINRATNLQQTTKSDENGRFSFADLQIGTYKVTFAKDGFKTQEYPDIIVQANRTTTLKASLQVGGASETITVTASPLLNETDTSNGYVLSTSAIQALPLGTGSFTQLATLAPGVHADPLGGADSNAGLGNMNINANGQRDTSNNFSVDGVSANNLFNGKSSSQVEENRNTLNTGQTSITGGLTRTNTSVYDAIGQGILSPPQETIQELRVNTSMYDAAQGNRSGAQIEVITKSGSNEYHGQVYDYLQNSDFNAAPFFFNATPSITQKVPPLHRNTFGGTMGGPIMKDKLFFFASYQGVRVSDALQGLSQFSVPSALTDDRSAATLAAEFTKGAPLSNNTTTVITANQIDPVALAILNAKLPNGQFLIPTPQIADANVGTLRFNTQLQAPASFTMDQFRGNIDYNFSPKDRIAFKYAFQTDPSVSPFGLDALAGFTQRLASGAQGLSIDNTTVLSPSLTWEQKVSFGRQIVFSNNDSPLTPGDVGMNIFGASIFPQLSIRGVRIGSSSTNQSLSIGPSQGAISDNAGIFQNNFAITNNLNWVWGRHTIAFGANLARSYMNVVNNDNQTGELNFNSFTDFLQGIISNTSTFNQLFVGASSRYFITNEAGAFVQDNFKFKTNLSFTLGLRFDYNGPLVESHGNLENFDPTQYKYNLATDTIVNTGLVIAGNNPNFATPGASDSTLTGRQWGFAPRLGVAWSPSFVKNLVFRAGYGIYYDRGELFSYLSPGAGNGNGGPFGVTRELPFVAILTPPAVGVPLSLTNPFGATAPTAPGGNPASFTVPNMAALVSGNSKINNPFTLGAYDSQNVLPYAQSWSLDVQWQPKNDLVFTLCYVGNHGTHQILPIPFNQAEIANATNPVNGQTSTYSQNLSALEPAKTRDGGNIDLRVPFLGYSPNSVLFESVGNSNYNALQFSVNKRLTHGLQINGSYTWSRSLDDASGVGLFLKSNDPTNPASSYGPSDFDRTHVISVGYLYEIPNLAASNQLLGRFINGWSISGVTVLESGTPYSVIDFSGAVASIFGDLNIIDPILPFAPTGSVATATLQGTRNINVANPVLNPNAFGANILVPSAANGIPADDLTETGFGNAGRNSFRAPFQSRTDMAFAKSIKLTERFNLKFRADIFNIFNTPSFDAPNNSISLASFQTINKVSQRVIATPSSTTLGVIQRTLGSPRLMQFSLHLNF